MAKSPEQYKIKVHFGIPHHYVLYKGRYTTMFVFPDYIPSWLRELSYPVASWENFDLTRDDISLQRSGLIRHPKTCKVNDRYFVATKAKGIVFEQFGSDELPTPPILRPYRGLGYVKDKRRIKPDGTLHMVEADDEPIGGLTEKLAKEEYKANLLLFQQGFPVLLPFGLGVYSQRILRTNKGESRTGFVLLGIEDIEDKRIPGFLVRVCGLGKYMNSLDDRGEIINEIYFKHGRLLRTFHHAGTILGAPHQSNFSVNKNKELTAHDLGGVLTRQEHPKYGFQGMTREQFFGYVLIDLAEAQGICFYHPGAPEKQVRLMTPKTDAYKAYKEDILTLRDIVLECEADPYLSFFQGYFYDINPKKIQDNFQPEKTYFDTFLKAGRNLWQSANQHLLARMIRWYIEREKL